MSAEIEILPVTSNEAVRILASLNTEALENLLDEIKNLRKVRLQGERACVRRLVRIINLLLDSSY